MMWLIYRPHIKTPVLRSNIVSDIISYISSELATWIAKNTDIDLRMINICVETTPYKESYSMLEKTIIHDKLHGKIYGEPKITFDILEEYKKQSYIKS